jgi:hypothetical protein
VLGMPADTVTMAQGLAAVAVAEAVIESASTGRTVDVTLPEVALEETLEEVMPEATREGTPGEREAASAGAQGRPSASRSRASVSP